MMNAEQVVTDAQQLKQSLGKLPEPVVHPVLIIVSGLPGTGKSYFSRKLGEQLSSVIVESDALRKKLFPLPVYSAEESQRLFSASYRLIEELLSSSISVILDATNLVEYHREFLYRIAERLKVKLIIVWVQAPKELVRQRLQGRSQGSDPLDKSDADWGIYQKMRMSVQRIRRNYFSVDTSRDISPFINKIVREAKH
jgi:predicted kinase